MSYNKKVLQEALDHMVKAFNEYYATQYKTEKCCKPKANPQLDLFTEEPAKVKTNNDTVNAPYWSVTPPPARNEDAYGWCLTTGGNVKFSNGTISAGTKLDYTVDITLVKDDANGNTVSTFRVKDVKFEDLSNVFKKLKEI